MLQMLQFTLDWVSRNLTMPTEIFTNGEALQLNLPKDTKDVKSNVRVRAKKCSKSDRAGLKMSVGKIHKELKGSYSSRVGGTAAVYLAAVAEYLTAEILELAAHAAKENKKLRISPRHLLFAIRQDDEINRLLKKTNATENGPIPLKLVQKKTAKRTRRARVSSK